MTNKIIKLILGKRMWTIIAKIRFFILLALLSWSRTVITIVKKHYIDGYWAFIRVSNRSTCWFKIRLLENFTILSVNPSHINSAKIAVRDMVFGLSPYHGYSKFLTSLLTFTPLTQAFSAWLAHHVRSPSFVLVTRFHTKIGMESLLYESCDSIPIRNKCVFIADRAEYVRPISTRSSTWHPSLKEILITLNLLSRKKCSNAIKLKRVKSSESKIG